MKLIRCQVYRSALADSTNGGVTAKHNDIYMEHPTGDIDPEKVDRSLIFKPEDCGDGYKRLVAVQKKENMAGPCFGGNIAMVRVGPNRAYEFYHIHDRFESWELNALLST